MRQWIERNADRKEFPRREVVEYFGESAVPMLVRELQPSGLFQFTLTFERATGKSWLNGLQPADFDRRMACADWAKRLLAIDPGVFARLAAKTPSNAEALEIARLFYGDHYLRAPVPVSTKYQCAVAGTCNGASPILSRDDLM